MRYKTKCSVVIVTLLLGIVIGVSFSFLAPDYIAPYLPEAIRGKAKDFEGIVVEKQQDQERLLLTIRIDQGTILATFKKKAPEVNLLVQQGDMLTLALHKYEPFIEDPSNKRVRKKESLLQTNPDEKKPLPFPSEESEQTLTHP